MVPDLHVWREYGTYNCSTENACAKSFVQRANARFGNRVRLKNYRSGTFENSAGSGIMIWCNTGDRRQPCDASRTKVFGDRDSSAAWVLSCAHPRGPHLASFGMHVYGDVALPATGESTTVLTARRVRPLFLSLYFSLPMHSLERIGKMKKNCLH